jgi:hypothetical protein
MPLRPPIDAARRDVHRAGPFAGSAAAEAALFARFVTTSGRSDFSIALIDRRLRFSRDFSVRIPTLKLPFWFRVQDSVMPRK